MRDPNPAADSVCSLVCTTNFRASDTVWVPTPGLHTSRSHLPQQIYEYRRCICTLGSVDIDKDHGSFQNLIIEIPSRSANWCSSSRPAIRSRRGKDGPL